MPLRHDAIDYAADASLSILPYFMPLMLSLLLLSCWLIFISLSLRHAAIFHWCRHFAAIIDYFRCRHYWLLPRPLDISW
jgi:hypothetical protein